MDFLQEERRKAVTEQKKSQCTKAEHKHWEGGAGIGAAGPPDAANSWDEERED